MMKNTIALRCGREMKDKPGTDDRMPIIVSALKHSRLAPYQAEVNQVATDSFAFQNSVVMKKEHDFSHNVYQGVREADKTIWQWSNNLTGELYTTAADSGNPGAATAYKLAIGTNNRAGFDWFNTLFFMADVQLGVVGADFSDNYTIRLDLVLADGTSVKYAESDLAATYSSGGSTADTYKDRLDMRFDDVGPTNQFYGIRWRVTGGTNSDIIWRLGWLDGRIQ